MLVMVKSHAFNDDNDESFNGKFDFYLFFLSMPTAFEIMSDIVNFLILLDDQISRSHGSRVGGSNFVEMAKVGIEDSAAQDGSENFWQ